MNENSHITVNGIRELMQQLMAALDDLREVEHRVQKADHVCRTAGKVVQTIRSWKVEEPPAPVPPCETIDPGQGQVPLHCRPRKTVSLLDEVGNAGQAGFRGPT